MLRILLMTFMFVSALAQTNAEIVTRKDTLWCFDRNLVIDVPVRTRPWVGNYIEGRWTTYTRLDTLCVAVYVGSMINLPTTELRDVVVTEKTVTDHFYRITGYKYYRGTRRNFIEVDFLGNGVNAAVLNVKDEDMPDAERIIKDLVMIPKNKMADTLRVSTFANEPRKSGTFRLEELKGQAVKCPQNKKKTFDLLKYKFSTEKPSEVNGSILSDSLLWKSEVEMLIPDTTVFKQTGEYDHIKEFTAPDSAVIYIGELWYSLPRMAMLDKVITGKFNSDDFFEVSGYKESNGEKLYFKEVDFLKNNLRCYYIGVRAEYKEQYDAIIESIKITTSDGTIKGIDSFQQSPPLSGTYDFSTYAE